MALVNRRVFSFFVAMALLLGAAPPAVRAAGSGSGRTADVAMEQRLLEEVNAGRAARGLPKLVADPRLTDVARARDQYVLDQGVFTHCLDGALTCTVDQLALPAALRQAGLSAAGAAENLALDTGQGQQAADDVIAMWLNSDEHRPSMLDPSFNATGLGVVCCGDVAAYGDTISHAFVVTQVFEKYAPGTISAVERSNEQAAATAAAGAACQFALGFKMLHDLDPAGVGSCADSEAYNPATGDAEQHSTGGVLVWRKADDRLAFTNGSWTWVLGPRGLARRPNGERFAWEPNPQGLPVAVSSGPG